jgi:hypothetical protein
VGVVALTVYHSSPAAAAWRATVVRAGVGQQPGQPEDGRLLPQPPPQFAGPDPSLSALAGLGLLFAVMTVMWLTAYALVVDRVRNVLQRNAVRQWIDRLTGVVLVGLGVRVATEAG